MGKRRWIETASLMRMPVGLFIALVLASLIGNLDFAWKLWVGIVLGVGFAASLVLMAWVNFSGLIIRERRKGRRAALVYGPLAMFILAAFVGWWIYVVVYVAS